MSIKTKFLSLVLPSGAKPSQTRTLHWMIRTFLVWMFVYMVLQGQDGFFARTADRIEVEWIKLLFLNIPLQILLTFVTSICAGSKRPVILKVGLWIGALNVVLIVVHIILSVASA
ncbi:MAG: hypothetical protein MUP98_07700 [Candidatus Aminicenantes bacterium]|nr:hypothetical protein [Candidatus Aminicenantes bacterium]